MARLDLEDIKLLPGGDIVLKGLEDLDNKQLTVEGLLVDMARPRLTRANLHIEPAYQLTTPSNHALFNLLCETFQNRELAYSRYNALVRKILSFASALERISRE